MPTAIMNLRLRIIVLAIATGASLLASQCQAAVEIARYSFSGHLRTSTDGESNSTASSISDGPGMQGVFTTRGVPKPGLGERYSDITATSVASAISLGEFLSFTIAPAGGYQLDLSSLSFDARAGTLKKTGGFFVRSSQDGFGANLNLLLINTAAVVSTVIDLTAPAFQHLIGPIDFRIYLFDSGSKSDTRAMWVDNVKLSGSVIPQSPTPAPPVTPEPSALVIWSVLGLALGGVTWRRQHRCQRDVARAAI